MALTCERCGTSTTRLVYVPAGAICDRCCYGVIDGQKGPGVIGDEIPGGFVQEHFGHEPEVFYSKSAMAKRAKALGLQPFVRHVEGDKHVQRWI